MALTGTAGTYTGTAYRGRSAQEDRWWAFTGKSMINLLDMSTLYHFLTLLRPAGAPQEKLGPGGAGGAGGTPPPSPQVEGYLCVLSLNRYLTDFASPWQTSFRQLPFTPVAAQSPFQFALGASVIVNH